MHPSRWTSEAPTTDLPPLPSGALIELSGSNGSGKTELLLRFLALRSSLTIAWMENHFSIYPLIFPHQGVALERVWFMNLARQPARQALWTAEQILKSGVFSALVLTDFFFSATELRRLQLSVGKTKAQIFLLNQEPTTEGSWPIRVQLQVHRRELDRKPVVEVLRWKNLSSIA